jgi:hypothetical protein
MSESIELPNDNDLSVYGKCQCSCGCNNFEQIMPDLHDCSGILVCGMCLKGLCVGTSPDPNLR